MASSATIPTRVMTATDLYDLRFVGDVALSPDGSQIAFAVRRVDGHQNRNRSSIWVVPAGGGEARQVTAGERLDVSPSWAPDGNRLAFVSDRSGNPDLYVLDLDAGGEATRLTSGPELGVSSPVWSPDGKQIAFLGKVPSMPEPGQVVDYPDVSDRPKVITSGKYKFNAYGFMDHRRKQVFVIAASGGEPKQLTSGPMGVGGPVWSSVTDLGVDSLAWSPDGSRLAFVSNRGDNEGNDQRHDVWTVDVNSRELTRVTPNNGRYGSPVWSPDGESIALTGNVYPCKGGSNNFLWIAPATGGELRRVTDWDYPIGGSGLMTDTGQNERRLPAWIDDTLYFLGPESGTTQIWSVPAAGGAPKRLTAGRHGIASWDISADGSTLVYDASTPTNPGDIFVQSLSDSSSDAKQLTWMNRELLSNIELPEPQEFWLDAPDGTGERIQGWIMKPPGFQSDKKYPLLLELHGGPARFYGYGWFHEFQYFAAEGYVLVYTNPRGSQGYGEEFATAIHGDWGTKPMMDVMAAVDYALEQGYVDPDHLYVTGGSYGGYLTNWVVTHTDRFRAAATQRGVCDMRSIAMAGDNGLLWLQDYFGGYPWEQPEVYARNSPISYIANCTTPLFIEHEEEDHRCPMDQAEQMFNSLQKLGVETVLIRYPNESHGMSRDGGPLHRVDRLVRIIDWFKRHE